MSSIVFWNGQFVPENQASVPITDRGFLFGDGVFTTMKVFQGRVQCFSRHYQRLKQHCLELGMEPPDIYIGWIQELIARNNALNGTWRMKILVTGGQSPSLDLSKRKPGQFIITLKPYQDKQEPCRLTKYPHPIVRPFSNIKSLAYLDRLSIQHYAFTKGFDDAIVLDAEGYTLETAFSNLFWRQGDTILSPSPSLPLLYGVAAQLVEEAANAIGHFHRHVCVKLEEIPDDAQLFICNSLKGCRSVSAINDQCFSFDLKWEKFFGEAFQKLIEQP